MVARGWGTRGMGKLLFMDTEFQYYKTKTFWRWTVVIVVQQNECTQCL